MSKGFATIGFLIYLVVGLYLLNAPFELVTMPEFISSIHNWILFVGGVLVIIGGMKYLFSSRQKRPLI